MGNLEKKISDELIYSQIDAVYYRILNKLKQLRQIEDAAKCASAERHDIDFKMLDEDVLENEERYTEKTDS